MALTPEVIEEGKVLLHNISDGIFRKQDVLNSEGLPSYAGPFNERQAIINPLTRKITWFD